MPYIVRHKKLWQYVGEVLIAPFAFFAAVVMIRRWVLLFGMACFGLCILLGAQVDLAEWVSPEFMLSCLGMVVFLWLAAIPLAIRDWWTTGGTEQEWDDRCVVLGKQFADLLISRQFNGAFELLGRRLQRQISPADFAQAHERVWEPAGSPIGIVELREFPVASAEQAVGDDDFPQWVPAEDRRAVIAILFDSTVPLHRLRADVLHLRLSICLENGEDRVASFRYSPVTQRA